MCVSDDEGVDSGSFVCDANLNEDDISYIIAATNQPLNNCLLLRLYMLSMTEVHK